MSHHSWTRVVRGSNPSLASPTRCVADRHAAPSLRRAGACSRRRTLRTSQAGRVKVCVRCRPPFREEVNTSTDVREQLVVAIPPHAPNPQLVQLYLEEKVRRCPLHGPAASGGSVLLCSRYDPGECRNAPVLAVKAPRVLLRPRLPADHDTGGAAWRLPCWLERGLPPPSLRLTQLRTRVWQDSVYNEVAGPIVANVMDGFNGTVLAYGQTGTGKTYTMVGLLAPHAPRAQPRDMWRCTPLWPQGILNRVVDEHAGLIPRAIGHVFGAYGGMCANAACAVPHP